MSTSYDASFLLVGLPDAGKTNFIVALDVVLENQGDPDGWVGDTFAPDRNYLAPLKATWLAGEELIRTNPSVGEEVAILRARDPKSNRVAELLLPDLLGETFRQQWELRRWHKDYRERLSKISGILLFVNCKDCATLNQIPRQWPLDLDVNQNLQALNWDLKYAPRQMKIVDLLQFIVESGEVPRPLRVALILSAWDVVDKPEVMLPKEPTAYLKKEWPLIYQYCESNLELITFRTFGVSARGGDDTDLPALLRLPGPCDRIKVVDGSHVSHDLTRPIRWLFDAL